MPFSYQDLELCCGGAGGGIEGGGFGSGNEGGDDGGSGHGVGFGAGGGVRGSAESVATGGDFHGGGGFGECWVMVEV